MAISLVQKAKNHNISTSVTVTTSATGAGNFLVALILDDNAFGDTITLPSGWTQDVAGGNSGDGFTLVIAHRENIPGGTTSHVFSTNGSGGNEFAVFLGEYSGMATTTPKDQSNSASGFNSTPMTAGSITTTQAAELIVMIGAQDSGGASPTLSASSGFTLEDSYVSSFSMTLGWEDQIVAATGTYSPTIGFTGGATVNQGGLQVSYKAASGATTQKTLTSTARITASTSKTLTSTARITAQTSKTLTSTARITAKATKTLTSTARITATTPRTLTSTARITAQTSRTLTSTARLTATTQKTLTSTAKIITGGTTQRTLTSTARITAKSTQTLASTARIQRTTSQTLTSTARVQIVSTRTLASVARITAKTTRTLASVARIQVTTARTLTSTANIVLPGNSTPRSTPTSTASVSTPTGKSGAGSPSSAPSGATPNGASTVSTPKASATAGGPSGRPS